MSLLPLYVTFGQHQVEIITPIANIHATLTCWFAPMLTPEPRQVIKQVRVTEVENGYLMMAGETVYEVINEPLWLLQAIKYEVVMGIIAARHDLLWFHAGAVANDQGAIVFAGEGGSGKSTLVTRFYQQGWQYLSDDVIPLDLLTGKILPFPQTPRVRQQTGEMVPRDRLTEIPKNEVMVEQAQICHNSVTIQAIVFVQHCPNIAAEVKVCSPGIAALELLRHCINFHQHKQIALQQVTELVKQRLTLEINSSNIEIAELLSLFHHSTSL